MKLVFSFQTVYSSRLWPMPCSGSMASCARHCSSLSIPCTFVSLIAVATITVGKLSSRQLRIVLNAINNDFLNIVECVFYTHSTRCWLVKTTMQSL